MRPDASARWPQIERLQQQLAREGLTMGVMERVRLQHVLYEAGVPSEERAFVAYVDEDPPRLRRLLSATLAKSAAERELVAGGYARWTAGLPRTMPRARAPAGASMPSMGAGVADRESSESKGGLRWVAMLMMLGALVFGGVALWPAGGVDHGGWSAINEASEPTDGGGDTGEAPLADTKHSGESEAPDRPREKKGATTYLGRAEPVDLTGRTVSVPWPVMVAVPRAWVEPPPVPWRSWLVGGISLVVFGLTWWRTRRRSLLPRPAVRAPRPGAGRVQPRLDRDGLPAFVERSEQETLIWGIGREVSDRETDRLDAERTIDATIARGGLPQLWFEPAFEHRGVWLWRDRRMKSGQADAKRLQAEIVDTLEAAALPVHVATFAKVPDRLQKVEGPEFSPHELDEQRRTARVIVLTDGHGLLRGRTARAEAGVRELLQRLQGWHALAVVVFGEHVDEVERLLEPYAIPCLRPADAVAHLAGALHGNAQVERERELLRWETACAIAPLRIRESDALALRNALGLDIEGFAVDALRRRFGRGQHLVWSAAQRAATLADYDRAFGYRAMGWDAVDERALLGRAVGFWREYYGQALADELLDPQTREHLEIERLVLGLWDRPEEVVRGRDGQDGLFALFQTEELEGAVRGLVSQYTDVRGSEQQVRLPWRYDERPVDVQVMLGRMGFAVRDTVPQVERAGRWGWGLGLALGVGVAALSHGVMATVMPEEVVASAEPEVHWVGPQPESREASCYWSDDYRSGRGWKCDVVSRSSSEVLWVKPDQVVETSWIGVEIPCEVVVPGQWDRSSRYSLHELRCTSEGRLVERPADRPEFSEAILFGGFDEPGLYRLARTLLDTGSVDRVSFGDVWQSTRIDLQVPETQRIVLGGTDDDVWFLRKFRDGVAAPGELDWARLAAQLDLAPRGVIPIDQVWPELDLAGGDFMLVGGGWEPQCPPGTVPSPASDCSELETRVSELRAEEQSGKSEGLHDWAEKNEIEATIAELESKLAQCRSSKLECVATSQDDAVGTNEALEEGPSPTTERAESEEDPQLGTGRAEVEAAPAAEESRPPTGRSDRPRRIRNCCVEADRLTELTCPPKQRGCVRWTGFGANEHKESRGKTECTAMWKCTDASRRESSPSDKLGEDQESPLQPSAP